MIGFTTSGSFDNTERYLKRLSSGDIFKILDRYGAMGAQALAAATPVDSGKTAASWTYEIKRERNTYSIIWGNTNVVNGTPVAVLLQLGHGTRTGGYVQGRDFINPTLQPIFDEITAKAWEEVTKS